MNDADAPSHTNPSKPSEVNPSQQVPCWGCIKNDHVQSSIRTQTMYLPKSPQVQNSNP